MAFDETRFPTDIALGARKGPGLNTTFVERPGGGFEAISRWETPRHQFDIQYGLRSFADLYVVKRFWWARRGGARGFRFKDWSDYATTATGSTHRKGDAAVDFEDANLEVGDGSTQTFQLKKQYVDALTTRERNITKLVAGTVVAGVDGVEGTEGLDWNLDYTTGLITFTPAPGIGEQPTWGGEFDVPVHFDEETDRWLAIDQRAFDDGNIASIGLLEQRDGLQLVEEAYPGGAKFHDNVTADLTISLTQGQYHRLGVSASGLDVIVPRADDLPEGAFLFQLHNSGTFDIDVRTEDDTLIIALPTGESIDLHLHQDTGGQKVWVGA